MICPWTWFWWMGATWLYEHKQNHKKSSLKLLVRFWNNLIEVFLEWPFSELFLKFWSVNKHGISEWRLLALYRHKEILVNFSLKATKKNWLEQSQKIRWAIQGHLGPLVLLFLQYFLPFLIQFSSVIPHTFSSQQLLWMSLNFCRVVESYTTDDRRELGGIVLVLTDCLQRIDLRTGGRWFDPGLGQYPFRGLMIVIATGFIPLSPLSVVLTMVIWESSQWFG